MSFLESAPQIYPKTVLILEAPNCVLTSVIDHILTNVTNHKILPGVIETYEVNDDYPVFCQVQNITLPKKNNNFIGYYREKSKFNSDAFNYDLFNALNSYFMNLLI